MSSKSSFINFSCPSSNPSFYCSLSLTSKTLLSMGEVVPFSVLFIQYQTDFRMGTASPHHLADFSVVKSYPPSCVVLVKHIPSSSLSYLQTLTIHTKREAQALYKQFQGQKDLTDYNYQQISDLKQGDQGPCSQHYNLHIFYPYYQHTLQEEIKIRSIKARRFALNQLISFALILVRLLQRLLSKSFSHGKISLSTVFLQQNKLILMNSNLAASLPLQSQIYSPESLISDIQGAASITKSDIFCIGILLIKLSHFDGFNYFDLHNRNVKWQQLNSAQAKVAALYGLPWKSFLNSCLQKSPKDRPSLVQLQQILQKMSQRQRVEEEPVTSDSVSVTFQPAFNLQLKKNEIFFTKSAQMQMHVQKPPPLHLVKTITNPFPTKNFPYITPVNFIPFRPINQEKHNLFPQQIQNCIKFSFGPLGYSDTLKRDVQDLPAFPLFPTAASVQSENIDQTQNFQPLRQQVKLDKPYYALQQYQDGSKFQGWKFFGKKNGLGKFFFEDGAIYHGNWANDQMNGNGILYYKQGQPAYNGQWQNDLFNGRGTIFNDNPTPLKNNYSAQDLNQLRDGWSKFQGMFEKDLKHGPGKLYFSNGEILQCDFKENQAHGVGKLIRISGRFERGRWQKNRRVQ